MLKYKWITGIDILIQNYFDNVCRIIKPEARQNVPLEDILEYNKMILREKEKYEQGRAEILEKFYKIQISPLAIIPSTFIHEFQLPGSQSQEFHCLELSGKNGLLIHSTASHLKELFNRFKNEESDPIALERKFKDYIMHTASYYKSREEITLPDISYFNDKKEICKIHHIETYLSPTIGNYHLKNFLPEEFWYNFEANEEMTIGTLVRINVGEDYPETFQVVLDQLPSIDKYDILPRYQKVCSPSYLPKLHTVLGNNGYVPKW